MGHLAGSPIYERLQERLDRSVEGAPAVPVLYEILKLLFTEEEAGIACRMPLKPMTLGQLSKRLGEPKGKLETTLNGMADKGLVLDLFMEGKGKSYYMLAPPIVGFFEFSMMRAREDFSQKELSHLMESYFWDTDEFLNTVFSGRTRLARALVHESALPEAPTVEILSHERASEVIGSAKAHAVSLCYCRHKKQHLGEPCRFPLENCLSLNGGAQTLARHNLARLIEREEALDILARSRELGLVQSADNVQRGVSYVCNCCGCCCGMLMAIHRKGITHAVTSTNFIAAIDATLCNGCGACVRRCPIEAIRMENEDGEKRGPAVVREEVCLGCGVCVAGCKKTAALSMAARAKRVFTPETVMDRVLLMALERGKLQNLLFDNWDDGGQQWVRRAMESVVNLPLMKMIPAGEQLRSRFVRALAQQIEKRTG